MKFQYSTYLSILLLSVIFSCTRKDEESNSVKYFARIPGIISPYIDYTPGGSISETEAANMAHYKVTFDLQNRISEIAFYRGTEPSNNAYFKTHKVKYKYLPEKTVRTYFDKVGRKAVLWRHYYDGKNIHKEEFLLNENGDKVKLYLYDSLDNRTESELGTYEFTFDKVDNSTFIQHQFKKNREPNILTEYFPLETSLIKLDSLGFLYSITNIDAKSKTIKMHEAAGYAEVVFDFDQYGNEMGWSFLDDSNKLVNRKPLYEIGGYGYAKWANEMDWHDQRLGISKGFIERIYDHEGNPVENNFGIHEVRYTNNVWGEMTSVSSFNKRGDKVLDTSYGYFRMTIEYDNMGERIKTEKFDIRENLIRD